MTQINEITLFTNRNALFFDEIGNAMPDYQSIFSWRPIPSYESDKLMAALKQIIKDQPDVYMARWGRTDDDTWRHLISVEEFACLVGLGPDYSELVCKQRAED